MSRVFDAQGRYLGDAGSDAADESFGAHVWEFFHPGTVQDEYTAVGKDAPSIDEIMSGAVSNIETDASAGIAAGVAQVEASLKVALLLGVVFGGMYLYNRVTR